MKNCLHLKTKSANDNPELIELGSMKVVSISGVDNPRIRLLKDSYARVIGDGYFTIPNSQDHLTEYTATAETILSFSDGTYKVELHYPSYSIAIWPMFISGFIINPYDLKIRNTFVAFSFANSKLATPTDLSEFSDKYPHLVSIIDIHGTENFVGNLSAFGTAIGMGDNAIINLRDTSQIDGTVESLVERLISNNITAKTYKLRPNAIITFNEESFDNNPELLLNFDGSGNATVYIGETRLGSYNGSVWSYT